MPLSRFDPIEIIMKYEECAIHHLSGYPNIYTFFIRGNEYAELPMDANVRDPSEKSIPYRDMVDTLGQNPYNFLLQNGGINVISSEVVIDKSTNTVKMYFPPGTGIVNGGHTQLALLNSKRKKDITDAIVHIEVIEKEFSQEAIAIVAASRNTASNVKPYSTAEKRGYFVKIKKCMFPKFEKHIVWWENRKVPSDKGLSAVDLIARLNLFNAVLYQSSWHNETEQPNKSATSKNSIFNYWLIHQQEFLHTYPLVNDIINLEEHILNTFHDVAPKGFTHLGVVKNFREEQRKTIFLNRDIYWELPKQLLLPLLASFRAAIKYDIRNKQVGWYVNPRDAFNDCGYVLLQELMRTYKTHHNEINQMSKDSNLWRILFDTVSKKIPKSSTWQMYDIPE